MFCQKCRGGTISIFKINIKWVFCSNIHIICYLSALSQTARSSLTSTCFNPLLSSLYHVISVDQVSFLPLGTMLMLFKSLLLLLFKIHLIYYIPPHLESLLFFSYPALSKAFPLLIRSCPFIFIVLCRHYNKSDYFLLIFNFNFRWLYAKDLHLHSSVLMS